MKQFMTEYHFSLLLMHEYFSTGVSARFYFIFGSTLLRTEYSKIMESQYPTVPCNMFCTRNACQLSKSLHYPKSLPDLEHAELFAALNGTILTITVQFSSVLHKRTLV